MADFGGETSFTFGGKRLKMRSSIKHDPSRYEAEGIVNQDGSTSRSMKPKGYTFEPTFEDAAGLDWDAIHRGGPYNITCIEDHTGVVHMWTGAKFTGTPKIDRGTGEVSGLNGLADSYRKQ